MPRVDPRLIRKASAIHPYIARILPICRDLRSARCELRWMRDRANTVFQEQSATVRSHGLQEYVARRSRGEPLQYILGSEFFGDLEIRCRPGVLIPRQETAASITHLVDLFSSNQDFLPPRLRLLDLCTGTGCIPLLFHHEFYRKIERSGSRRDAVSLDMIGVDISRAAINLAQENRKRHLDSLASGDSNDDSYQRSLQDAAFLMGDVLADTTSADHRQAPPLLQALRQHEQADNAAYDILISNPPYISTNDYWRTTSPSVRKYEPVAALVPPDPSKAGNEPASRADIFYRKIFDSTIRTNVQVVLFEVADLAQAKRVATMAIQQGIWTGLEIWRDDPASRFSERKYKYNSTIVPILGSGNGRSVLTFRGNGTKWLGKKS